MHNLVKLASDIDSMEFQTKADEASRQAGRWGCCSVAERILGIDKEWNDLSSIKQDDIIGEYPALENMGLQFSNAVNECEWDEAIKLHKQIQKHRINKAALTRRITQAKAFDPYT